MILLEPLKVHHESLKKCYSHIKNKSILGNIITAEKINEGKDVDSWYHLDDGPGYEIASINKDHIKKHSFINPAFEDESRYRKITSKAITLDSLFETQDIKDIDFLFIDAEGLDSDSIKSIDFDVYDIKNIF